MSTEPQPTSQLPDRASTTMQFESPDPVSAQWPGFPFPPPLLGIDYRTVDRAAGRWLRAVADLVHSGEENLNILFDHSPVTETCTELDLPAAALRVVPAAGLYALGSLHAGPPEKAVGASLSALFAAPSLVQIVRLRAAARKLDR